MEKAVEAVQKGSSYREVELQIGISKSTTNRRVKGLEQKTMCGQTALSYEEELVFVYHLIAVSQWDFPFSNLDVCLLVKGYLEKVCQKSKCFRENTPG